MEKKELFAPVWRHWKHAFYRYRWLVVGTMVSYGITTFLNDVYKATVWQRIIDALGQHKNPFHLFLTIPVIIIVSWFINRFGDYCITRSESNIIRYLKNYALEHILTYDTNFFLNTFIGSVVAKARRFASVSEQVYDEFAFTVLRVFVILTGVFVIALRTVPIVGFVLLGWSILFGLTSWYLSKLRTPYDLQSARADSYTTGHLSDIVGAVHMVHSYAREKHEYENFKETSQLEHDHRYRKWLRKNVQGAVQAVLVIILELTLMYLVVKKASDGIISVGTVVLVQSFIASVASYMWNFGRSIATVRNAFADAQEMAVILSEKMADAESRNKPSCSTESMQSYDIDFSQVQFSYPQRSISVLNDVSFTLEAGKRYGVIGKTGSGKTTITRLLLRQFDLVGNSGSIRIGGISIYDLPVHELRQLISYVPQDPHFPFRTVREIIAFGKPDATDEEIIQAAKKASCYDFIIEHLEYGFETKVGEQGVKLSGGQRQRLAIAAALLKDAPILILDEPTAALDSETEEAIQMVLKTMKGKTMIVIAHRLTTVAELDEIIVLKNGTVAERGSHSNLLSENGVYASFWKKQFHYN